MIEDFKTNINNKISIVRGFNGYGEDFKVNPFTGKEIVDGVLSSSPYVYSRFIINDIEIDFEYYGPLQLEKEDEDIELIEGDEDFISIYNIEKGEKKWIKVRDFYSPSDHSNLLYVLYVCVHLVFDEDFMEGYNDGEFYDFIDEGINHTIDLNYADIVSQFISYYGN